MITATVVAALLTVTTTLKPTAPAEPVGFHADQDLHLLAFTMWGEARSEGLEGMRAVGHVVWNRTISPVYPNDVPSVVLQPRQFSFWNSKPQLPAQFSWADQRAWSQAYEIAQEILNGTSADPTHGALFYHTTAVSPSWAQDTEHTTILGAHIFYASLN